MSSEPLVPRQAAPDPDLARREADLARLDRAIAGREAAVRAHEVAVEAFRVRYLTAFGAAFAELDDLEARIALAAAAAKPDDNAKRNKAERLATRVALPGKELPSPPKPAPTDELRAVFRALTKRIHPDLADDEADRARRAALMVEANAAYAAGDRGALEALASREAPGATPSPLARLEREVREAEARLAKLDARLADAEGSELARLMRRTAKAAEDGRDLFRKFAGEIEDELKHARKRLRALERRAAKRGGQEDA